MRLLLITCSLILLYRFLSTLDLILGGLGIQIWLRDIEKRHFWRHLSDLGPCEAKKWTASLRKCKRILFLLIRHDFEPLFWKAYGSRIAFRASTKETLHCFEVGRPACWRLLNQGKRIIIRITSLDPRADTRSVTMRGGPPSACWIKVVLTNDLTLLLYSLVWER